MESIHNRVVKAELSDVDGIVALNDQFGPQRFGIEIEGFRWGKADWVQKRIEKGDYYVVRDAKGVAAAMCLHRDTSELSPELFRGFPPETTAVMDAMAIRRELQYSGLSRQLRGWVEEKCREDGVTTLVGESFAAYGLEPLYRRWGFIRSEKPAQYAGHDYYLYHKDIPAVQCLEKRTGRVIG